MENKEKQCYFLKKIGVVSTFYSFFFWNSLGTANTTHLSCGFVGIYGAVICGALTIDTK